MQTVLDYDIARQAITYPSRVDLSQFSIIEDLAAKVLAEAWESSPFLELDLSGLVKISDYSAKQLAKCSGTLILDGLKSISDVAIRSLADTQLKLFLNGLPHLTQSALVSLSKSTGHLLSLNGLTTLTRVEAYLLARKTSSSKYCHPTLILNGLSELSTEIALELSKTLGELHLNGVRTLSNHAARGLATFAGDLFLNGLKDLSHEAAEALANHRGRLHLEGIKHLSRQVAEALAEHRGDIFLGGLESVASDVLCELAKSTADYPEGRDLYLNGLSSLPEEAIEAFTHHRSNLQLGGLRSISPLFVKQLAKGEGHFSIYFDGLTHLEEEIAREFKWHLGSLSLDGLTAMSDAVAAELSEHKGWISVEGLVEFPDKPGHVALVKKLASQAHDLYLNRLPAIGPEIASVLAKSSCDIHLNGVKSISTEVAAELSKSRNRLFLDGLETLSPDVAALLARHRGTLSLKGLRHLPVSLAESLAFGRGDILLDGLEELGDAAAIALSHQARSVSLRGIRKLSKTAAMAFLSRLERTCLSSEVEIPAELLIDFDYKRVRDLSDADASRLIKRQDFLELNRIEYLSDSVATILAQHGSHLCLNGLPAISDRAAEALASHRGGAIQLLGLKSISYDAAKSLLEHPNLQWEFSELSDSLASALVKSHHERLVLDNVRHLTDSAAKILSGFCGDLSLNGLSDLSDVAAGCLANHRGALVLNGITSISDVAAESLALHKGPVALLGLREISARGALALSTNANDFYLDGSISHSETVGEEIANSERIFLVDAIRYLFFREELTQQSILNAVRSNNRLFDIKIGNSHNDLLRRNVSPVDWEVFDFSEIKDLSIELAEGLASLHGSRLNLNGVVSISREIAQTLVKTKSLWLSLDGIERLDDSIATALAACKSGLSLNGIKELSDSCAEILASHKGSLFLNGWMTFSESDAEGIHFIECDGLRKKIIGQLSFHNQGSISSGKAKLLINIANTAGYTWFDDPPLLELPNVYCLTPETAAILSEYQGCGIEFSHLFEISDTCAASLSEFKGDLRLDGLKTLSESTATSFQNHEGELHISVLRSISEPVAKALSLYRGRALHLNGVESISPAIAESLAKYSGDLYMLGLRSICDNVASEFAKCEHVPHLQDAIQVSEWASVLITGVSGKLFPSSMDTLSESFAESVAKMHKDRPLSFRSITSLSVNSAKALAKHQGGLDLSGIRSISDDAALALADYSGKLKIDGLIAGVNDSGALSPLLACLLSKHSTDLCLDGLSHISDAAAKALSEFSGERLSLNGLNFLPSTVAECLKECSVKELFLNGLIELSDEVASELAHSKCNLLHLEGLTKLSAVSAETLLEKRGVPMQLSNLPATSAAVLSPALEPFQILAEQISKQSIVLKSKANEEGYLYERVGAKEIATELSAKGFKVLSDQIWLEGRIDELGLYKVTVWLHPFVKTELKVWVIPNTGN